MRRHYGQLDRLECGFDEHQADVLASGLPRVRLHDLRYGAASLVHSAGAADSSELIALRTRPFILTTPTCRDVHEHDGLAGLIQRQRGHE